MRNRLVYIGLLILSLPALFWGYFIIANLPNYYRDVGTNDYLGVALGVVLAIVALYGLVIGRPFSTLPTYLKWLVLIASIAASIFAVIFILLLVIALNWN